MEFDWSNPPFRLEGISIKEIEESFEDPFAIRLLPEDLSSQAVRYCVLGKSISNQCIFSVFRTDGKIYRVIASRVAAPDEMHFYDRKNGEANL